MFVTVLSAKLQKKHQLVSGKILTCTVGLELLNSLFFPSFSQASQPDELTIDEHEMLEVIEDGDMEDWVKVNQSYLGYFSGLTPPAEV